MPAAQAVALLLPSTAQFLKTSEIIGVVVTTIELSKNFS